MSRGPYMQDDNVILQAGLDPRTGKPLKEKRCSYKEDVRHQLRVKDQQEAINRYKWYNLPNNISSQELERMLYYRGKLCFFYFEELDEFLFMPYTLASDESIALDFYGRWRYVKPIPFYDGGTDEEKKNMAKIRTLLSTKKLKALYGQHLEAVTYDDLKNSAVILYDYTPQLGNTPTPRQVLNEGIVDLESDCYPFMHTALKNGTGVQGLRVNNPDEASNVYAFNKTLEVAALQGDQKIPIVSSGSGLEFQDLSAGNVSKAEEFLVAMQSLDTYRQSLLGLGTGGLFEKKAHLLQAEASTNIGVADMPLQDGLSQRQRFCDIVNSIIPLGIWCEISETALGTDSDMDGQISNNDPDTSSYNNETTEEETNA